MNVYLNISKYF